MHILLSIYLWEKFYVSSLFIYRFTSHLRTSTEGRPDLGLCSALGAFGQGGILIVPQLLCHGASGFCSFIQRNVPHPSFSFPLRHTGGGAEDLY
jgi:hypothetical protein